MNWHLDFNPTPLPVQLGYTEPVMLLGSCFAEEIGALLSQNKFNACLNPNGIVFNPISVTQSLQRYLEGRAYTEDELFQHDGLWHSWQHHGVYSDNDKTSVLHGINDSVKQAHSHIQHPGWLVITLGSAHVYENKTSGNIVANCHKAPSKEFNKRLLRTDEIVAAFDNFIYKWRRTNADGKILFTVSPVRYKRDGLVENNLSKAILLESVHHLAHKYSGVYYFPAYELVIDVLRDYRFYKEDMVHPNAQAIEYVWEHFIKTCIDKYSQDVLQQVQQVMKSALHRPLHPDTDGYAKFIQATCKQIETLETQYPFLNFTAEKQQLENL